MEDKPNKIVSYFVDFLFSKEKNFQRWLFLLIFLGFFLRIVAAINLDVFADDMVYASQSAGIFDSKILSTHSNPPLFFYMTDLIFKFFGYGVLASRFWPLIFGTLLIPLSFLITRKFFDEKIAILSAFFVTFSNFMIRMTYNEQSLMVLFFSMFGVYLGINYLEQKKLHFLILSATSFGLGCLTKYNTPFFILSFLLFSCIYLKLKKEKIFTKLHLKHFIIFSIIIFLFCLPFLTFNYLLYKDKGIVDVYFSRVVNLNSTQQLYSGLAGQDSKLSDNLFRKQTFNNIFIPIKTDLILFLFSLLGVILLFFKKQKNSIFFILLFLTIPFIFQSIGSGLEKHFIFMIFILALPAGFGLDFFLSKFKFSNLKVFFLILLLIFMIVNLGTQYGTPTNYFSKSETSQIKNFIVQNVNENDLIITDSRIYSAKSFWIVTDNHFIDLQNFVSFYNDNKETHINKGVLTKVYVIECLNDDCGWGWVKDQPGFNQTSEEILTSLKEQAYLEKIIKSKSYSGNELFGGIEETDVYAIYSLNLNLNENLVNSVDYSNSFYFVPYLYKNRSNYLFNYTTYNAFDSLLEKISYYILLVSIFVAISYIFLLFYILKRG